MKFNQVFYNLRKDISVEDDDVGNKTGNERIK